MKTSAKRKPKPDPKPQAKSTAKRKQHSRSATDRVAIAEVKAHLSRYVREVQERGRTITITQHGRDTAVLAPVKTAADALPPLNIRPALDPRPLGEIIKGLRGLPEGGGVSDEDIQEALDWTRADRF